MDNGWIKLHRKFLDNPMSKKPKLTLLWITLLLLANHKDKKFMWNGETIIIKEGQILTGRKQLSEQTGIPETTIERALNQFEKSGQQIEQQKTTKYRLITIINWKEYQKSDRKVDNKRTTNGQQTDTNKNDKNEKNDKKILTSGQSPQDINKLIELFKPLNTLTYRKWYANKTQRAAIGRLAEALGPKLEMAINTAVIANTKPYAPTISTPLQLEEKLSALRAFVAKEKNKVKDNKNILCEI